jgi:hypothetical protein
VIERGARVRLIAAFRELWSYRAIPSRSANATYLSSTSSRTPHRLGGDPAVAFMAIFMLDDRLAGISGGSIDCTAFTLSAPVPWKFLSTGVRSAQTLSSQSAH